MALATFGPTERDMNVLVGQYASDWLATQFDATTTLYFPRVEVKAPADDRAPWNERPHLELFWDGMVTNQDQLRTRMVFALSQIFAIDVNDDGNRPKRAAYFMDRLAENAFGNYRDLLEEVTYSPIMAEWLTYYRNRKGDERSGRMPDENYAREVMQLFTIGVVELNMDGTERTDGSGQAIETYTNDDVVGLARVFTGLSGKGRDFWNRDDDSWWSRLVMYDEQHSELEKTFLGTTIPAGTSGEESIDIALDTLFEHPNVAPFVSRQLIQRFTSSNPSPDYIERVATAFEAGEFVADNGRRFGTGQRGDLEATLAAILLDPSLMQDLNAQGVGTGKLREPVLQFIGWARAFDITNVDASNERYLRDTRAPNDRLTQQPFRPPSVFNFYRPGFVAPNTESGAAGMTAPELQILNETSTLGYVDFMTRYVFDTAPEDDDRNTWAPDYSDEITLADDPAALADHLNELLVGGRMEQATRDDIAAVVQAIPIGTDEPDEDRLRRVQAAVMVAINAPSYRTLR